LRRKCACGQHTGGEGECAECKKKHEGQSSGELVHRRVARTGTGVTAGAAAPPIVHEVLGSSGQSLDEDTRSFFGRRFHHDFSPVRVHTDSRAAESARSVDAQAYTVGSHIVFGLQQYSPRTDQGRKLLAHELAHVTQNPDTGNMDGTLRVGSASAPEERAAQSAEASALSDVRNGVASGAATAGADNSSLARKVVAASVGCPANTNSAPADPVQKLTDIESHAQGLVQGAAILAQLESSSFTLGVHNPNSNPFVAFQARFGLPPAQGKGFLNRMTGTVKATRDDATSEELSLVADRLQAIANNFDSTIEYRCITGPTTYKGCDGHCTGRDATTCAGQRLHMICPRFWQLVAGSPEVLLIHESAHMLWANVVHGAPGAGGRFRHAECYASFVADLFNLPPGRPACPP
jgi:hypothetical protein